MQRCEAMACGMLNVMFLPGSKSADYIRPDTVPKEFPYMTFHTFKIPGSLKLDSENSE